MTILITGDIHGRLDIDTLSAMKFNKRNMSRDDYVIVCGDFGLIWDANLSPASAYELTLDWLSEQPYTLLFVDGNHENHDRLAAYPVSEWHGGHVHMIRENVIHLMRGEMFDIDGFLFLALGGAYSVDANTRTPGVSWWKNEIPDDAERDSIIANIEKYGWYCDYVIAHDCPADIVYTLNLRAGTEYRADEYEVWLQWIADRLTFEHWFFGHYHDDALNIGVGGKYTVLYDGIVDLSDMYWSDRMQDLPLPRPQNPVGYRIDEIADIAKVDVSEVSTAINRCLNGSTVALDENGDALIMPSDIHLVLSWL